MAFFNLLNFFGIFFYLSGRNETKRNDNFYFLSFPAFSNLFWLIMNPHWHFLIFLLFFGNFVLHFGQERNGTIFFIFSLSQLVPAYSGLKWGSSGIVLIFWIFLLFFILEFSITPRVGTERIDNFYFPLSHLFPPYSGMKWFHNGIF